jgi:hypothetical protein
MRLKVWFALVWFVLLAAAAQDSPVPGLSPRDKALIEEAQNLWLATADHVWPGASGVQAPWLYITADHEYAIGFPFNLKGFSPVRGTMHDRRSIQVRSRTMARDLTAAFPFEGVHTVAIGTPEALEMSPSKWILTATHEMFHVFQAAKGAHEKERTLKIGSADVPSWHLNFPFPYSDAGVMRLIHLQGYPAWLAAQSSDPLDAKYNIGTALEAGHVYRSRLTQITHNDEAYLYSQQQEWSEGVAFYSEYKIAERAALPRYKPTEAFTSIKSVYSYRELWHEVYRAHPFLAKHAGRAIKNRTAFYHLGFGKALALDKANPSWKERYFLPNVWLNDLLAEASGSAAP